MKQPYVYTMPESFLKDKSVPARWRVLAVINGFILNGGCFYGSNEWLMEQLGCSEPTVSSAFKELEELKEIRTERTKRTRKVYKTSRDPSSFGSETQVEPARDPSQLLPNSVSNSVKEIPALPAGVTIEEIPDKPRKEPRPQKAVYEPLLRWAEGERGSTFVHRTKQYAALAEARAAGIKSTALKERWLEMAEEEYWVKTGFDWKNVVSSFNRKGA